MSQRNTKRRSLKRLLRKRETSEEHEPEAEADVSEEAEPEEAEEDSKTAAGVRWKAGGMRDKLEQLRSRPRQLAQHCQLGAYCFVKLLPQAMREKPDHISFERIVMSRIVIALVLGLKQRVC